MKNAELYRGQRVYIDRADRRRREAIVLSSIATWSDHFNRYDGRKAAVMVKSEGYEYNYDTGRSTKVTRWNPEVVSPRVLNDANDTDRKEAIAESAAKAERERRERERQATRRKNIARAKALGLNVNEYSVSRLADGGSAYFDLDQLERFADQRPKFLNLTTAISIAAAFEAGKGYEWQTFVRQLPLAA